MNKAFLILGSNIRPEINIPRALGFLDKSFSIKMISNTWRTRSVGTPADDFLNTALEIETALDELLLKEKCLCHIEEIMGRVRQKDKNAPRTIDIDIVVFNDRIIDLDIFHQEHLALPLSELLPNLRLNQKSLTLADVALNLHNHGSAICIGKIVPETK
jgi:2-amino-4-hydroxy-6-hydroxymethyldihydropteridine diphosphokinase